jgi:anti-anti-sigma factor
MSWYIEGVVFVIELQGELDGLTAPALEKEIVAQISGTQCNLVLNMEQISFMSSAGLRLVLGLVREARRYGGDVRLARLQPAIADTVAMGFNNLIQTFGSVPGAVNSFMPLQAETRTNWNDTFLEQMRSLGDPAADDAIQAVFDQGQIEAVNALMRQLANNDELPSTELPPAIRTYLANTADLPPWADMTRIRRGQALFGRYGLQMTVVLFLVSLPVDFAARKGVHVLYLTQRMTRNPYRRIVETAQLLLDLMEPGGFEQNGKGFRSTQKVRLMHAAVRYLLLHSDQWDTDRYDIPINQEDMAGTLMSFSYTIINRLELLGIELTLEQQEDFLHIWNVGGYLMGVMPELIPPNVNAAKLLSETIARRQIFSSMDVNIEGKELTALLIKMLRDAIPGTMFDLIPETLMRHLLGDEIADFLGIERTSWSGAVKSFRWANHMLKETGDRIPVLASLIELFSRKMLEGVMLYSLGGDRTNFHIPAALREDWGIQVDAG